MASSTHDINEIPEELLVVLDSVQVAIYIDANSVKNLPILKKYLTSIVLPIMGISKAMGKTSDKQSVNENDVLKLSQAIINHIHYIMCHPKNEKSLIVMDKVLYKVITKLKLYLDVSEVFSFFKDEDLNI